MRYLLVDRITEWKAGESIKGIKTVAMSEDYLEFHFPGNPIMPGVLILEALTQLTAWLEAASSDFKNWLLISGVRKCKFYGFAFPGDSLELEARPLPGPAKDGRIYYGVASVNGKKKITVEFEGKIVPLGELEDLAEQRRFFNLLTRGER